MDTLKQDLRALYRRDLDQLIENVIETPEEDLWHVPEGVNNSCGVLVQHLVGNLNHFIGQGMGDTGYVRQRDREFTSTSVSKEELVESIEDLKLTLDEVLDSIEDGSLDQDFPMDTPFDFSAGGVLMHLYGHLNYHLGQVNYLRRILSQKDEK